MSGSTTVIFVLSLVFGILLFIGCLMMLMLRSIRLATSRQRAELEAEGVVLDSGRVPVTIRYNGFRAPGMAMGIGIQKGSITAVLTQRRLVFIPSRRQYLRIDRADLHRYTVSTKDGALHLHSTEPANATGTIDFRLSVSDPGAWANALRDAGAKT